MQENFSLVLGEKISLTGCGRTDTGVHAREYHAHFDSIADNLDDHKLVFKLNSKLPQDIAIDSMKRVKPDAHARYSALSRTYEYHISRRKDPFNLLYSHFIYGDLDIESMQAAAGLLLHVSDFTSFSKVDTDVKTNICRVTHARWEESPGKLVFNITADRFLRNMVRAIAGTMIELGFQKISLEDFKTIIERKDRSAAGKSAPAKGLFLTQVKYPEEIYI